MKKTILTVLLLLGATLVEAQQGINLNNESDSLSYAFGVAQTRGIKDYLTTRMGVDVTYINDFIQGLREVTKAGNDKKKTAYYAGLQIGQQIMQIVTGFGGELFGENSKKSINKSYFIEGFVAGLKEDNTVMDTINANAISEELIRRIKAKHVEETYAP